MKSGFFIILHFFLLAEITYCQNQYDLTIVGRMDFADSLGRLPIGLIDCLKSDLKINFKYGFNEKKIPINLKDVPESVKKIVSQPFSSPGKVSLLLDHPWYIDSAPAAYVPQSDIKIAYSMIESTRIPQPWINILNKRFDAIVVPDEFLIAIYRRSGIIKPIFVLPCGIYLEDFLAQPIKKAPNNSFTFGVSASLSPWKNLELLIEAFAKEFNNCLNVSLLIHTKSKRPEVVSNYIKKLRAKNIFVIGKTLTQKQYVAFMSSLDCYVLISKGEGFSITPREALALGIPCILSNNTAHKTICDTGLVKAVPSYIPEPAYYGAFGSYCGNHFNCKIIDVQLALRDVYQHYNIYLKKAHAGRQWVQQYLYKNLKARYLNLIKPKKVALGDKNIISDNFMITTSKNLYEKYIKLKIE